METKSIQYWIQDWLKYWERANMVNVNAIQSQNDMREARRFCSCMRSEGFATVTDDAMWEALQDMRNKKQEWIQTLLKQNY